MNLFLESRRQVKAGSKAIRNTPLSRRLRNTDVGCAGDFHRYREESMNVLLNERTVLHSQLGWYRELFVPKRNEKLLFLSII